jgi:predicted transcriptional regulator
MKLFIGLACARNALAIEIRKQHAEDGCVCCECNQAHKTLSRTILKHPDKFYSNYRKQVERDMKLFEEWTFPRR